MNWPARSSPPLPDDRKNAKHARRIQQAQALHALGNLQEAERICERLLAKRPSDFDALYLLAAIKSAQGRLSEALALIARALKTNSWSVEALINHGYLLSRLDRLDEALASYDRVVEIRPDFAEAHNGRGCVLLDMQRPAEALECFTKALAIRPRYADALNNAGKAHLDLGCLEDAASRLGQAVDAQPGHVEAHFNLGNACRQLGQPDEALASYDRAIALNPAHAEALGNRGVVLWELARPDEALASFDRALAINPGHLTVLNSRGCLMLELGRHAEAAIDFGRALECWPDFAQARYNRGLLRLLLGDMREGWTDYEWRWQVEELAPLRRWFSQPQWTGKESIDGKAILLHAEQGFGDTIQFVRYVSLVAARGAKVILEVQPQLARLLAGLHETALVVAQGEPLPPFDFHCPLLSLPLAFDTALDTIPANIPHIGASQEDVTRWAELIPHAKPLRVGIAWSGTTRRKNDRSIPLFDLAPLLATRDVQFVSLQKEVRDDDEATLRAHPDLLHFGDALGDFADTAALISALDLIITIDTSVAHLAGALGKPVWIMLPSVPDFRWLLGRRDSPWYPTARLFRQSHTGDWSDVIASICDELRVIGH